MTPGEQFALLMFMLGLAAAVFGWLIRALVASLRSDIRDNTDAVHTLTEAFGKLGERVARLEGPRRR